MKPNSLKVAHEAPKQSAHSLQPSTPQCNFSNLISFDFPHYDLHSSHTGLFTSSPTSQACICFRASAPGVPSAWNTNSPDVHMAHSSMFFAQLAISPENFSVRPSLSTLCQVLTHPALPLPLPCYFLHNMSLSDIFYMCASQSPHRQTLLILQSPARLDYSLMSSPPMAAPNFFPFSKIHQT